MRSARWQPTGLARASIVLHMLAVLAVIVAPAQWPWAAGAILANHVLLTLVGMWPRSRWLGPNCTRLPAAAAAQNKIALSFDDGPDPAVTPQVLDILDRYAARATFFCIGEKAARYPELCRDIVRRGHAVENHSQHHRYYFAFLGIAGLTREIQAAQETIAAITGREPLFFRAPAGLRSPCWIRYWPNSDCVWWRGPGAALIRVARTRRRSAADCCAVYRQAPYCCCMMAITHAPRRVCR